MVTKERVVICDVCKNRVAETKCIICGNDMCSGCTVSIEVSNPDNYHLLAVNYSNKVGKFNICQECKRKIGEVNLKEFEKEIVDYTKGLIMSSKF